VTGALVRAAVAALVQVAGLVLLAAGLAHAVARAAGQADGALTVPLLAAAAGVVLRAAAGWAGELLAARDARRAEEELRAALVARLAASPAAVAAAGGPGPAAVLATTRLADLGPALATRLPALAQAVVVPPVLLVVLAWTDLLSAALVAVTLPLVPVFMVLVGLTTRDGTTAAARALDRIAAHVAELVRGLPVLVGLGRAAEQTAALAELGEASRRRTLSTLRLAFLSALVLELLATLSVALVAVTVGLRLVHGDLELAVGLTALLLAPEAFAPLRALGAAHHAGEDAALAAAEARAVLAAPAPVAVPAAPADDDDPRGADVAVTALTVRFPGRAVPALPPVDLAVRPGELVALRGTSGSGKSTLLAVLAGTGRPLRAGRRHGGRRPGRGVAYVPQHPRTTGATVADELRRHAGSGLGGSRTIVDELVGEAHVVEALARTGATDLAGRDCTTLSPGELQRVALARALVRVRRGARLLLLDEPTAHLDDAAAARVAAVLAGLHGTVSILLVTHDAGLAALADRTVDLGAPHTPPARPLPPRDRRSRGHQRRSPRDRRSRRHAHRRGAALVAPGAGARGRRRHRLGRRRRGAHRGLRLADRAGRRDAAGAHPAGRHRRRAGLRPGPRRAALGGADDRARRRAAAGRGPAGAGLGALAAQGPAADRTPGSALARVVGDVGLVQDLLGARRPPGAGRRHGDRRDARRAGAGLPRRGRRRGGGPAGHRRAGPRRAPPGGRRGRARRGRAAGGRAARHHHGARGRGRPAGARPGRPGRRRTWRGSPRTGRRPTAHAPGPARWAPGRSSSAPAGRGRRGVGRGRLRPLGPAVAVLALAPLALAEPLAGLVTALQRRGTLADARDRLDTVLTAPVPADPADPLPVPAPVPRAGHRRPGRRLARRPGRARDLTTRRRRTAAGWSCAGPRAQASRRSSRAAGGRCGPARAAGRAGRRAHRPADRDASARARPGCRRRRTCSPRRSGEPGPGRAARAARRAGRRGPDAGRAGGPGLGGLLAGLPEGLDTPVGAGGTALSGGERRRLAAARALLADRDVVLLDEPTAHLDPPTAAALLRDLRAALAGRVVVCVTHDDTVERPGDTVVRLGAAVTALAA
jgi:ATP-binding cassette subfamily C protein CydCD